MEAVERFLFQRGVEDGKTIVLLIDEAQILPKFVLEILRILLNYETNEYKILQLVLVGQMELLPNFWDRIALRYVLNPLGEDEVRELIDYRLRQAGYTGAAPLFTNEAVSRIWEYTRGYPRKLSLCCHNVLEYLVMYDRKVVDEDIVSQVIDSEVEPTAAWGDVSKSGAKALEEEAGSPPRRMTLSRDEQGPRLPSLRVRYGS